MLNNVVIVLGRERHQIATRSPSAKTRKKKDITESHHAFRENTINDRMFPMVPIISKVIVPYLLRKSAIFASICMCM